MACHPLGLGTPYTLKSHRDPPTVTSIELTVFEMLEVFEWKSSKDY